MQSGKFDNRDRRIRRRFDTMQRMAGERGGAAGRGVCNAYMGAESVRAFSPYTYIESEWRFRVLSRSQAPAAGNRARRRLREF